MEEETMPAPFNLIGIDHVVLRAADPIALERFYMDVLGCAFEKRQGTLTQLRAGQALIDIVPADEAGPAHGTSSTGGAQRSSVRSRPARTCGTTAIGSMRSRPTSIAASACRSITSAARPAGRTMH
jgi:hypothetical protein